MTTTDTRPGKHLRIHLVTVLAAAYVVAWYALGSRSPRATPSAAPAPVAPAPATVWYGDLAPAERPRVALPPGWSIASATPATTAATLTRTPQRVAPSRTRRIRTRSS